MVVFVDLEDDVSDDPHADPNEPCGFSSFRKHHIGGKVTAKVTADGHGESVQERPNPNINSFSAALGAYPYVRPSFFEGHPSQFESQCIDILSIQHRHPTGPQRGPQHPRRPITHMPSGPRQPAAIPHPPRAADAPLRE